MQSLTSEKVAEKHNLNLEDEEEEKTVGKSSVLHYDSRINSTKDSSNFTTTDHNDLNEAFILMNSEQSPEFSFANKCINDSNQPEEEIFK